MKDLLDLLWAFAVTVLIGAFGFAFYWAIGRFGEYQVKREATNQRILDNLAKPQWVVPVPTAIVNTGNEKLSDYLGKSSDYGSGVVAHGSFLGGNPFAPPILTEADVRRIVREELNKSKEK